MKTCKVVGVLVASVLTITSTAFGGGLGGINLPDGRFHESGNASSSEVKRTYPSLSTSFYAPSDQSAASHWHIALDWRGYPFGFAVFNKE